MDKNTSAIHSPFPRPDAYGALAMPVYHCLAYEFPDHQAMIDSFTQVSDDPDYSRVTNPTVIHLEQMVRRLTGATDVVAFTSGMAAISAAVMAVAGAGRRVVTSRHLFGNTYLLLTRTLARFGVETVLADLTDPEEVRRVVNDRTCCIYLETITNPQMEVADIRALADIAHAAGAALLADTTMIPFIYTDARALGVDVEILSSTKYISGGATSLGGLVIDYGTCPDMARNLRKDMLMNLGGYMTPHAAYMQTLGMETLSTRYEAQERNAMAVATALSQRPEVKVCYPGLPDNPYHELAARQFGGHFGAMLTLTLPSQEACFRMIDALKLVRRATNLFDNRSLAIHPASTIFGTIDADTRRAMDVSELLIRLSIGLENPADVIADLNQALDIALSRN
ncbi:MAG: PLP-dependent aspartate aminotransferase family protein [Muribaculaceae bacterium]|nr:PLP-dependent aspartate aminotransferase family protein [Muribaculaceae bacterium]MDE7342590.1 PLP-dependent aspartate aminotransferase family protein [Muribaculaceae bacterium]